MRMCQTHWEVLKKALDARGLMKFSSNSGEEAIKRLVDNKFDPLMYAHNRILEESLRLVGLTLFTTDEFGNERCPLCSIPHDSEECGEYPHATCTWIKGCVNEVYEVVVKQGLIVSA